MASAMLISREDAFRTDMLGLTKLARVATRSVSSAAEITRHVECWLGPATMPQPPRDSDGTRGDDYKALTEFAGYCVRSQVESRLGLSDEDWKFVKSLQGIDVKAGGDRVRVETNLRFEKSLDEGMFDTRAAAIRRMRKLLRKKAPDFLNDLYHIKGLSFGYNWPMLFVSIKAVDLHRVEHRVSVKADMSDGADLLDRAFEKVARSIMNYHYRTRFFTGLRAELMSFRFRRRRSRRW